MEDMKEKKLLLRADMEARLKKLTAFEVSQKLRKIEDRLFDFANFMEAKTVLFHLTEHMMATENILKHIHMLEKTLVLPLFREGKPGVKLFKIEALNRDVIDAPHLGIKVPNATRCKELPVEMMDIAFIPGLVFDEKGNRIGQGLGRYDYLIPRLPLTTRKVALAFEEQIISQVPVESMDRPVDIIITDQRILYKI